MAQKLLVIVGPTSSGKSALAVELARKFSGEVISADSRQVYRGLNIGTGKITAREMRGVRHHLLDVASPKQVFTAHDFMMKARGAISSISRRDRFPIVAGGTGFYIDALLDRVILPDVPADPAFRRLHEDASAAELFRILRKIDHDRAGTIDPHNKPRLIRALEIARALGKAPRTPEDGPLYEALWIGLDLPKEELDKKIDARLKTRMKQGMLAEARRLHAGGLSYARMEALGLEYRSMARLLQKKVTREQMTDELSRAIKQYAKRQRTYWQRNKEIRWFSPNDAAAVEEVVRAWATNSPDILGARTL